MTHGLHLPQNNRVHLHACADYEKCRELPGFVRHPPPVQTGRETFTKGTVYVAHAAVAVEARKQTMIPRMHNRQDTLVEVAIFCSMAQKK